MCGGRETVGKRKGLRNNLWYGGSLKGKESTIVRPQCMWIFPWWGGGCVGPTPFHKPTIWGVIIIHAGVCVCVPHLPSRLEKAWQKHTRVGGQKGLHGGPGIYLNVPLPLLNTLCTPPHTSNSRYLWRRPTSLSAWKQWGSRMLYPPTHLVMRFLNVSIACFSIRTWTWPSGYYIIVLCLDRGYVDA